ncbi:male-enhanced antigen 1 [Protopterus annectens]|uniref:male-enhanced antigen 1 n=1 Tax=Protopterus annectens TaxID=7888 RepID=UPI001CF9F8F8|nr:male-enhanced antigen 1 [Protopterus annectens]
MGLYLPEPPVDSEEEDDEKLGGAKAWNNRNSIPMDPEHVELVKRTMADIKLPAISIPAWAKEMSNDQWTDIVQQAVQSRQSSAGLTE